MKKKNGFKSVQGVPSIEDWYWGLQYIQTQIEKEKQNNEIDLPGTKVLTKNVTTSSTGEIILNTKEGNKSVLPESQNPVVTPLLLLLLSLLLLLWSNPDLIII